MFRLMIALGVAYMLMPEVEQNTAVTAAPDNGAQVNGAQVAEVTAYDTYSAARSLFEDASGFCDRNPETCMTGMAILNDLEARARSGLAQLSRPAPVPPNPVADTIKTGSVE